MTGLAQHCFLFDYEMSSSAAFAAPPDAEEKLAALRGSELISYFRSLPWRQTIETFLKRSPEEDLRNLVRRIETALKQPGLEIDELPNSSLSEA